MKAKRATRTEETPRLAVVIPVWRARFLGEALESLRAQTDGRFRVYVGDDASPDDVAGVVAKYGEGLDLVYYRFEENLGGRDLVGQWERCIGLTQGEEWIWVFADDDELESGCVAGFYATIEKWPEARLLALGMTVVNESGEETGKCTEPPERESADELLLALAEGLGREVRGADHVFARSLYEESGGFVWMPKALYTDLATWVKFARVSGGLVRLEGGRLRWRLHGGCTSNFGKVGIRGPYLEAMGRFARFAVEFAAEWPLAKRAALIRHLERIAKDVIWSVGGKPEPGERRRLFRIYAEIGGRGLAWRVRLLYWRAAVRGWPGVSLWCRWRKRRWMDRKAKP